jgi:hypothetical protein
LKKKIFSFILLFLPVVAFTQTWPFEVWHEGKVVITEEDTLRGLIKYDIQKDLIEFTTKDNTAEVFTARKVIFFEIFDERARRYRQFFALPFTTNGTYKTPVFFELMTEGKLTLLAREYLETVTTSTYYSGTYSRIVLSYRYFFINEQGEIAQFVGNKNDLLDMMGKQGDEVEKYIKENRLRFDEKYDFVRIIAYYNSLFKT